MKPGPLLLLAVCFISLTLCVQAQQNENMVADLEDARIASVAARQEVVANLLHTGNQLRDAGENAKAARAWNRAGRLQLQLSQLDQASETYANALRLVQQTADSPTIVDSLNGLARVYQRLGRCREVEPLISRALVLSDQHEYVEGKAEALMVSSPCESDRSKALNLAQQSVQLWQSIDNKLGLARSYLVLGEFQMVQYKLFEAAESLQKALELWRELNVPNQVAESYINLGFVEYRKGAWQAALGFHTQAEKLIDSEAEPLIMGQIKAGLAENFVESGLLETGLEKYRESLDYYRLTKIPEHTIGIEFCIGQVHYFQRNFSEAIAMLSKARAEAEERDYLMVVALSDDFLGRTYYELNDHEVALQHYQAALELFERSKLPMESARMVALIGQLYQQQGAYKKASANYQKALLAFRRLSDQVNVAATLYALGVLELKQDHVDEAQGYLRESISITENMRRVSTSVDLTAAFSARVHERYEKYIDCLMRKYRATGSQNFAIEAFRTTESARARSLTELLHATQANLFPGLDPNLVAQEKKLRESLQMLENAKVRLLSSNYKTSELNVLETEYEQTRSKRDQLLKQIHALSPSYERKSAPTAWDLQTIQDQVIADDQTVLLTYSLGSEKSYVWAVTRSGIESHELPAEEQIVKAANRVYELLKTNPLRGTNNELTVAARELSQIILAPVAGQLTRNRIIVIPDGVLHYIPFQVLPSPVNDESLIVSKEIINAPSASILGELQQEAAQRQTPANLLAAFGDPVFDTNRSETRNTNINGQDVMAAARLRSALHDTDLNDGTFDLSKVGRLFYAKHELDRLREVAGEKALIVSDYSATRERFLSTDLTQYAILHVATHGLFNPKRPEASGLLLTNVGQGEQHLNGFIGLHDIYELRAPVRLVVLSACQTALGKDVRGEGLLGVTRGFMYAGASGVVASLWQVDDEATAELMKVFYENMLQQGMRPSDALRAAQNSIRQQPKWRAPYYWAGFTLQGEYRQTIEPQARGLASVWIALSVVGFFVVAAGVLWYGYRRSRRIS
jgi:CHAT domain-containing protein/tetratricopeptide (TPR) repeat protein